MPAADYQLFVVDLRVVAQNDATFSLRSFFDSFYALYCNKRTSVYANEFAAEFLSERLQGIVYEVLTIVMIDRYVLLVCAKANDIGNGN
jgi:hypothetical protein